MGTASSKPSSPNRRAACGWIPANLYRALRRLQREGLIEDSTGPDSNDGPERRYFRLTPAGRRVASEEAARLNRLAKLARTRKLLPGDTR